MVTIVLHTIVHFYIYNVNLTFIAVVPLILLQSAY